MTNTLNALAFDQLSSFFISIGSPLKGQHKKALKAFMETLERGLKGGLENKYYLLSLDPGMGKTSACVEFIKAWRKQGYKPDSSILIGLSTLAELNSFVTAIGLPSDEFGVLTGDREMNAKGLPSNLHDQARVLFTTQQMIRSRTKGRSFDEANEFHYNGQPRALRLWDESILPNEGVVIRRDDLLGLVSPLRPIFPDYVDRLEALSRSIDSATEGALVLVDAALHLDNDQYRGVEASLSSGQKATMSMLQLVAGSSLRAVREERYGSVLVGSTPTLPDDFAPLIILDASGRVRDTYVQWGEHRGNLERLTSAGNSFHKLNVHVWDHASGKDAVNDHETREEFATAIGSLFERDPEGEWLIISYKDAIDGLKVAIDRNKPTTVNPTLHYIHWGRHHSTNDFRDVDNVIIVGQFTYQPTDYIALVLASSGFPPASGALPETREMKVGEYRHNLLQAVCRASVRKASQEIAGRCNAFLITSQNRMEVVLSKTFPGCNIIEWKGEGQLQGRLLEATEYIRERLILGDDESISKRDLAAGIGITSQNLAGNILSKPAFRDFMASNRLEMTTRNIHKAVCGFEPIEDGYIYNGEV